MNRRSFIKAIAASAVVPLVALKAKDTVPFPPPAYTCTNAESTGLTVEKILEAKKWLKDHDTEGPYYISRYDETPICDWRAQAV